MNDLTLICETCHLPIAGDTGSLYVRIGEVTAKKVADREWKKARLSGSAIDIHEFLTLPGDIHWRSAHDACRADHDQGCYEIDAPLIARWPQLARWTAHLMAKNWFGLSDWDDLLREVAGEIPAVRVRVVAREAA